MINNVRIICSDEVVSAEQCYNSIFLAGPTTRNSKEWTYWRQEVIQFFKNDNVTLLIPEPRDPSKGWPKFIEQFNWELDCLTMAKKIMFWVPRELKKHPALTTNVEFGFWINDKRTVYGRPNDAEKIRYLDALWEHCDRWPKPFSDLNKMCTFIKNTL